MRLVGCKYILYEACFILCSVLLVTEVCGSDHPQPQQAAAAAKSTAAPVRTIVGLPPAIEEPEPSTSMSTETPVFSVYCCHLSPIGAGTVWDVWDSSHTDFVACGTSMHSSHTEFGPVLSFIPSAHPVFYRWNVCKCK